MATGRRDAILAAAVRLFEEKGYHATSVQDIAEAVGLRKGSLYHYISSKDDLLIEIVLDAIRAHTDRLAQTAGLALPASERLARAITQHVKAIAENRATFTTYLRESYAINREQQAPVLEQSDRYARLLERIIRDGQEAGEFRPADPKMAAMAVLGACNWLYRWYSPEGRLGPDDVARSFVKLFLEGLKVG